MTQTQQILDHMMRHGSITPLEALKEYGCMRLGARIWDLKRMGYDIDAQIIISHRENGESVRFAKYSFRRAA